MTKYFLEEQFQSLNKRTLPLEESRSLVVKMVARDHHVSHQTEAKTAGLNLRDV